MASLLGSLVPVQGALLSEWTSLTSEIPQGPEAKRKEE